MTTDNLTRVTHAERWEVLSGDYLHDMPVSRIDAYSAITGQFIRCLGIIFASTDAADICLEHNQSVKQA